MNNAINAAIDDSYALEYEDISSGGVAAVVRAINYSCSTGHPLHVAGLTDEQAEVLAFNSLKSETRKRQTRLGAPPRAYWRLYQGQDKDGRGWVVRVKI